MKIYTTGKGKFSGKIAIPVISVLLLLSLILQCARDPFSPPFQAAPPDVTPEGIIHAYHKLYAEIETRDIYISPVISARFLMSLNMTIHEILTDYLPLKRSIIPEKTTQPENPDSLIVSHMVNVALAHQLETIFSNRVKTSKNLIAVLYSSIEKQLHSQTSNHRAALSVYTSRATTLSDSMAVRYLPQDYINFPNFTSRDSLRHVTYDASGKQITEWVHSLVKYSSILPDVSKQSFQLIDKSSFNPLSGKELHKEALEVYALSKPLQFEYKWIAEFWSDDLPGVTFSPATRWISILNQIIEKEKPSLDIVRDAYFYISLAMHETAVICWDFKYSTLQTRPSHYIREKIDPAWVPFHANPPFPAYPSGHAAFGEAASTVLEYFFGDPYSFTDNTHQGNRAFLSEPRSYASFTEMSRENALSRLYMGVHFRKDCEDGILLGKNLSKSILRILIPPSSFIYNPEPSQHQKQLN